MTEAEYQAAMTANRLRLAADILAQRAKDARNLADSLDRQAAEIRALAGPVPA